MKKLLALILILSVTLCLAACCGMTGHTVPRLVTRISISCDGETRTYASEESMQAILAYLRLLSPVPTADPAIPQGSLYQIRLFYSDGSQKEYLQQGCRFRENGENWEIITERDSLALTKLFDLLEPEPALSPI